jgi:hypothetical protein
MGCLLWALLETASSPALAEPWAAGFAKRQRIDVDSVNAFRDVQVEATVDTSEAALDCSDVRFTTADDGGEIPFWIESGCRTAQTKAWFRAPQLRAGRTSFYVYSSRPNTPAASNARAVFFSFDDFSTAPRPRWPDIACTPVQETFVWSPSETLVLTNSAPDTACGATVGLIDSSWESSFAVEFRFRLTEFSGVSSGAPSMPGGDGFALGFFSAGPNLSFPLSENSFGQPLGLYSDGYTVRFDTYANQEATNPNTDLFHNYVSFTERVDGGSARLAATVGGDVFLRDLAWHTARLSVSGRTARIDIDGNAVLSTTQTWRTANRKIVFGAATAGAYARHEIDDVRVWRLMAPAPVVGVLPLESRADGGAVFDLDAGAQPHADASTPDTSDGGMTGDDPNDAGRATS